MKNFCKIFSLFTFVFSVQMAMAEESAQVKTLSPHEIQARIETSIALNTQIQPSTKEVNLVTQSHLIENPEKIVLTDDESDLLK